MGWMATVRGGMVLVALFVCLVCKAASVPAMTQPPGCFQANGCHYFVTSDVTGYRGSTPQDACNNFAQTAFAWVGPTAKIIESGGTNAGYYCQVWASNGTYYSGGGIYYVGPIAGIASCPAHSTLDANKTTCSCDSGYMPDAGGAMCVLPSNRIALTGPSRTKSLVAGPALIQTATVTNTAGAAVSGVGVNIAISNGTSVAGMTDGNGSFTFTYVPPYRATSDHLSASCSNCTNTAEKDITVDPCDVCAPTVGNPAQPASGEKLQTEVDWVDSAAHPLTITRNYRSFGTPSAGLGSNWSLPWAANAIVQEVEATIRLGDGRRINFRRPATQQPWVADGNADSLAAVQGGFVYRRASDGVNYVFNGIGQLDRIVQRNGWAMTVQRDAAGNVASVTNAFGRSLVFSYAGGKLTAITTPDGSRIAYGFDAAGSLVSVTYPDSTSRGYMYESPFGLTGIVDERGVRVATFAYDSRGYAISTQHAGAQSFSVTYTQPADARGRIVAGMTVDPSLFRTTATVSDPLGTPRTYEWTGGDGHVYLVGGSAPGGLSSVASRGAGSLPSIETDFKGVSTTFTWDVNRRVKTQQVEAAGLPEARATSTEWHSVFDLPVRITEAGRVTGYTYDPLGNRLTESVSDASGSETRTRKWTYNAQSLVASETDAAGRAWRYGYDTAGNRTSAIDPLGRTTTYSFDAAGRMVMRTGPDGLAMTTSYDARGRVLQTRRGDEATSYAYTATGQLARVALANGYAVTYAYDTADRLVAASDTRGASVTYTLDGAGNRVREEVKDANGNVVLATGRSIDSLGRVSATQGAQGQTTQFGYDANGEPISTTDPLNQTTRQALDALRRTTSTTFPDNASAEQSWNALDSVTGITDPKGVKTRYGVNAFGEVMSETSPDIGITTYERDAAGSVVASTDARGVTARMAYDALGRITEIKYDDQVQSFAYDAQGNVSRIDDGSGSTVYVRDAQGRVLTKTQTVLDSTSNPGKYVVQYGYTTGDLTSVKYPSGLQVSYRRLAGRITQVDVQAPGTTKTVKPVIAFATGITHTALGQPKSWSWFNGDAAARSFDADGRMTANEFASYTWDAASRITGITQQLWADNGTGIAQTPVTWAVGYDIRNRLTSMNRAGHSTTFTYDANSNRLSKMEIATGELDLEGQFDAPNLSLTTSETPVIDAGSNRQLGFSVFTTASDATQTSSTTTDVAYAVDAAGNMTSDGLRTFVYDSANRLSKVQAVRSGEAVGYDYLHNALGQRVFKSDATIQQPQDATRVTKGFLDWLQSTLGWLFKSAGGGSSMTKTGLAFVYDEQGNMLASYGNGSSAGLAEQMEFIWLPQEDGTAMPIGAYKDGQFYAVHADHLGTPRLITDAAKAVAWQWPYSAFGANKPTGVLKAVLSKKTKDTPAAVAQLKATAPALDHRHRYPGQYCDSESALCYNGWRYYSPPRGDYPQMDPTGLPAGWNRRVYVYGNPLIYMDSDGLQATAVLGGGGGAAASGGAATAAAGAAVTGAAVGGAGLLGYAVGTLIYPLIEEPLADLIDKCMKEDSCPPCKTVSGKVVPLGTIGYRFDPVPPGRPHHPYTGSHYNIYKANQYPSPKCDCFWQPIGAADGANGLPPPAGAIPVEPFAN